jgi:hypothetical protein
MFAMMLALAAPQALPASLRNVDAELTGIVSAARSGALFHPPGHYACGNPVREDRRREVHLEYLRAETEYQALGGIFPADEALEITTESYHTDCAGPEPLQRAEWQWRVNAIERTLSRMRALLARKRALLQRR